MDFKTSEITPEMRQRMIDSRDILLHVANEQWTQEQEDILNFMFRSHYAIPIIMKKFQISRQTLYRKVKEIRNKKIQQLRMIDGEHGDPGVRF